MPLPAMGAGTAIREHGARDNQGGPIVGGAPASIVLYDAAAERLIDARDTASLSRNNPYAGLTLPGEVVVTFLRGRPTVRDRVLVEAVTV